MYTRLGISNRVCTLATLLALTGIMLFAQAPACPIGTTNSIVTTTAPGVEANLPIKAMNSGAQTFTTPGSVSDCFKLSALTFSVQKQGSPGDLTVTIYSVGVNGIPSSPIINASAMLASASVGTSMSDQTVTFSNPPALVGGTMFAAVFSSGSTTGNNHYKLGVVEIWPGGPYAGGMYWKTDQSGIWEFAQGGRLDLRMAVCLTPCSSGCTLTQGYWKNHESRWPVTNLTLGTTTYTKQQLLDILRTETGGNGLVSLAHQLIAAKLNIANGADPSTISAAISAADTLIGSNVLPPVGFGSAAPSLTSALNDTLTQYNEGTIGPGHCAE